MLGLRIGLLITLEEKRYRINFSAIDNCIEKGFNVVGFNNKEQGKRE